MSKNSPSKVEPMDNRDLTSALLKLTDRVVKLEAPVKEDDIKSAGRFKSYKEEIREMLSKHNDDRNTQRKDFEEHFNAIGQHINMVLPGLNRLENRVNAIWNTFNAFVRFIEKLVTEPVSTDRGFDHFDGVVTATNFLHPKWPTTREEFQTGFMEAGREVFKEHQAHEKAELERLRSEKKEHGVALTPAKAQTDGTDSVLLEMNSMVIDHIQKNRDDIQERIELDGEARKKLSEALTSVKSKIVES